MWHELKTDDFDSLLMMQGRTTVQGKDLWGNDNVKPKRSMTRGFMKWENKNNPSESEFIPIGFPTFCDPASN